MKKLIILTLLTFGFETTFAQLRSNGFNKENKIKGLQYQKINSTNSPLKARLDKKGNKLKLDNILSEYNSGSKERSHYIYDLKGWLINELDSNWSSVKRIWEIDLYEYSRDLKGNMTVIIHSTWDHDLNKFQPEEREAYTYYPDNHASSYIYGMWDEDEETFINYLKREYTYDSKGNMDSSLHLSWDHNINKFVNDELYTYHYNNNNYMTMDQTQRWNSNNNAWDNVWKLEYLYENNEQNLLWLKFEWNVTTLNFDTTGKIEYTFDLNHNILSSKSWMLLTVNKTWYLDNYEKYEYSFDARGNILSRLNLEWNKIDKKFVNKEKIVRTYDLKDNLTTEIITKWDLDENAWVNTSKIERTRDNSISRNQLILPFSEDFNSYYFNTKLDKDIEFGWSRNALEWYKKDSSVFNYSNFEGLGINEIAFDQDLKLFPNPASDIIHIKFKNANKDLEIKIMDIKGEIVFTEIMDRQDCINISNLYKGIYFIQIYYGTTLLGNKKLVKY